MKKRDIKENTTVRLLYDTESLDFDYMLISKGTLGTVMDAEVNPITGDIIGYYVIVHALTEEYLYFDTDDFEVVDEDALSELGLDSEDESEF